MSPEQQNIAIAKACNYDLHIIIKNGVYYRPNAAGYTESLKEAWKLPKAEAMKYEMYTDRENVSYCEKVFVKPAPIPGYVNDLNAIHKAEKKLTLDQRDIYQQQLYRICERERRMAPINWLTINSTAAQRAEAFLRTLKLWIE